jgi:L-lactate dehydrogenase complex protein LldG
MIIGHASASNLARQRILQRLRNAPIESIAKPELSTESESADPEDLLVQFRRGSEAFHTEVIDTRAGHWATSLAEVCATKQIRNLLLPPNDLLDLASWPNGPQLSRFTQAIESFKTELFNTVDAGLTIADGAIADTGTLFQAQPQRMPRTLSLVPPIHICLLDPRRITATLQSAIATERWGAAMPSNLIFITGPSKTADIQQTLAYGAHGPRELIVLLTEAL